MCIFYSCYLLIVVYVQNPSVTHTCNGSFFCMCADMVPCWHGLETVNYCLGMVSVLLKEFYLQVHQGHSYGKQRRQYTWLMLSHPS